MAILEVGLAKLVQVLGWVMKLMARLVVLTWIWRLRR